MSISPSPAESAGFALWPRALSRVMSHITANAGRQDVWAALASGLVDEFGVDLAQIRLYDPASDALHVRAVAGGKRGPATPGERLPPRANTPDAGAMLGDAPVVIDPIGANDGFSSLDNIRDEGFKAYAGFPLIVGDRRCGAMSLGRSVPF